MAEKKASVKKDYVLEGKAGEQLNQSAEQIAAALAQTAASKSLALMISTPSKDVGEVAPEYKRRGMPTMIKPETIPVGSVVEATILGIVASPVTTIKGFLLHLRHEESGTEFTFPCTGVIRNALAPGVRNDDKELKEALDKEVGNILLLKRLADKPSKYKKQMFVFDVFTREP